MVDTRVLPSGKVYRQMFDAQVIVFMVSERQMCVLHIVYVFSIVDNFWCKILVWRQLLALIVERLCSGSVVSGSIWLAEEARSGWGRRSAQWRCGRLCITAAQWDIKHHHTVCCWCSKELDFNVKTLIIKVLSLIGTHFILVEKEVRTRMIVRRFGVFQTLLVRTESLISDTELFAVFSPFPLFFLKTFLLQCYYTK